MPTEDFSPRYADLDLWPTGDAVLAMLEAQMAGSAAVAVRAGEIAAAADAASARLREGNGRLIYVGAGTSGRIAVQDGVELGPTYGWPEDRLVYALAGGMDALQSSAEGAEDDAAEGTDVIDRAAPTASDVVIGLAASGRTPYTVAAVRAGAAAGALTLGIANNPGTPLLDAAAHPILLETGAEVVAGSTRMKAGTAQKIALNAFSTAVMIRLGRVHAGLMVAMRASNDKLRDRAAVMVCELAAVKRGVADDALRVTGGDIKRAILVAGGANPDQANALLRDTGDNLREALRKLSDTRPG